MPGLDHDGIGLWLDSGGGEPSEVKEELGAVVKNLGKGGVVPKCVGGVLQGGGAVGTSFQVRDVYNDPLHGPVPGGGSTQGSQTYY